MVYGKKWTLLAFLSLLFIAAMVQLFPSFNHYVWGSDTGEYFRLSKLFVENRGGSFDYQGWGIAYKEFPGMFLLTGAFHMLSGLELWSCVRYLIPTLAVLNIALFYFLALEIAGRRDVALLSSLVLVLSMPHAYTTSHAMAGTLGEIFLLLIFSLMLISYRRGGKKIYFGLGLGLIALIVTHHLSTFILILILGFLPLFRALLRSHDDKYKIRREGKVLFAAILGMFTYWILFTENFWQQIVLDSIGNGSYLLPILAFIAVPYILLLNKIYDRRIFSPPERRLSSRLYRFVFLALILISFLLTFSITGIPGTGIKIPMRYALYFIPFVIILSYTSLGPAYIDTEREGLTPLAWAMAIVFLLPPAVLIFPQVIIPYRLGQYVMVGTALLAGAGMVYFLRDLGAKERGLGRPFIIITIIAFLLLPLGTYPPREVMGGFEEGIDWKEYRSVYWIRGQVPEERGVSADHRMSSLIFGVGEKNATWDYAYDTYHSPDAEGCEDELRECKYPHDEMTIDYVYLSDPMKSGVALLQWENAEPMSQPAIEKFEREPFLKVYDDGTSELYLVV